jgi:hypothetical protein
MVLDVGWHIGSFAAEAFTFWGSTRAPAYRQRRMLIITFWEHTKNERNIFILCG